MLEGLVSLMAEIALTVSQRTEIDRVNERTELCILLGGRSGVVDDAMADTAIVGNDLAGVANVFAVMTTKTTF